MWPLPRHDERRLVRVPAPHFGLEPDACTTSTKAAPPSAEADPCTSTAAPGSRAAVRQGARPLRHRRQRARQPEPRRLCRRRVQRLPDRVRCLRRLPRARHRRRPTGALGGRDLREAEGIAKDAGVHCDVCHRVDVHRPRRTRRRRWPPGRCTAHPNARARSASAPGSRSRSARTTTSRTRAWASCSATTSRRRRLCAGCHQNDQPTTHRSARWPDGRLPSTAPTTSGAPAPPTPTRPARVATCRPTPRPPTAPTLQLFGGDAARWRRGRLAAPARLGQAPLVHRTPPARERAARVGRLARHHQGHERRPRHCPRHRQQRLPRPRDPDRRAAALARAHGRSPLRRSARCGTPGSRRRRHPRLRRRVRPAVRRRRLDHLARRPARRGDPRRRAPRRAPRLHGLRAVLGRPLQPRRQRPAGRARRLRGAHPHGHARRQSPRSPAPDPGRRT